MSKQIENRLESKNKSVANAVQVANEKHDLSNPIQRKEASANNTGLPDNLRAGIEKLSGYSMNDVKVHYNSSQPAQLQAHAYAQGTSIHIAPGQERHLPHEAWHVVQQKQGRVQPTTQLRSKVNVNDDPVLEHEADIMGAKALSLPVQKKSEVSTGNVQSAVVQRAKHSVDEVIAALENIEFGGSLFEAKIKLNSEQKSEQDVTLKNIARGRLAKLDTQKANYTDEQYTALQISYVADVVAEHIAKSEKVNMPRMKDKISSLLLTHFGTAVNEGFGEAHDHATSISLAKHLTGKDPVALYIKKMIPLGKAAEQIRAVADSAGKQAADILKMYIQRFKDRVTGFSREQVATGEGSDLYTGKDEFPIKDLVGHHSTGLHDYVSGASDTYTISENYKWDGAIGDRFEELRNALNPEDEEVVADGDGLPPYVAALRSILPDDEKGQAQAKWDAMETRINNKPILIIINGAHLNAKADTGADHMDYKSMIEFMLESRSVSELIKPEMESEERVPALKTFDAAKVLPSVGTTLEARKKTYGPWREEKDTRAAQKQLNTGEYPTFGFVPYYPYQKIGANINTYYGDTVLEIKAAKKAGARYKWTDQGKLKSSAGEALEELALRDKVQLAAAATYLLHGNFTIYPSTKMEAIMSGAIHIPNDVQRIVVGKNSANDAFFGKETEKTASVDLMSDMKWFMLSEGTLPHIADAGRKDRMLTGLMEHSGSTNYEGLKARILDCLDRYNAATPAETGSLWWKADNPEKTKIEGIKTTLNSGEVIEDWKTAINAFLLIANPPANSVASAAKAELSGYRDQLQDAEDARDSIKDIV